jgi:hypothetical protein
MCELRIVIGGWQQARAVAATIGSAHRLEISRHHRSRDVTPNCFLAAAQIPFRLVFACMRQDALIAVQPTGRDGRQARRYSSAPTT